ncbi:hypothetical protein CHGG_02704 [Chaetomium globosum CBS 148.51]|uniref:Uncharacterized protein n=1 Tax=Chaetomium globosum (strain ATCC 6205 / CBS 148.51 / DSM 1962 / NBRC 6347 / NRRL 1970) TaxID=306901 RepID=Q2HAQ0_CHAGB|nr:uncharacterized protein CHGG_02704 [Chaetomium globosum CBS 148.51]EAQ90769.1 hypothetical protein CHGG_02704 [Chaetomium globosum CBS 148.51]
MAREEQERLLPRMRSVTFRGASTLEEANDGFQEAGKTKRPRGRPPGFPIAQEEAARSSRQGKLTFARKVDTDLTGDRGDGVGGLGVTTPEAADTLEADGQDVGMQGAGWAPFNRSTTNSEETGQDSWTGEPKGIAV